MEGCSIQIGLYINIEVWTRENGAEDVASIGSGCLQEFQFRRRQRIPVQSGDHVTVLIGVLRARHHGESVVPNVQVCSFALQLLHFISPFVYVLLGLTLNVGVVSICTKRYDSAKSLSLIGQKAPSACQLMTRFA
uniref:Uncharacterized protein n=1 Tax=Schistocephalus solidus TaxID=70667 RepID=A0A0X3NX03_SCHSO